MKINGDDVLGIVVIISICIVLCFGIYLKIKLEHEKTIQKAIECGYQPLCIGGDYWNKGD